MWTNILINYKQEQTKILVRVLPLGFVELKKDDTLMDLIRIILSIIIPPLGVFLQEGLGKHFWINIVLTLLGYIPGVLHAIYIIIKR